MLIRNGTYTLYQGVQFEISSLDEKNYSLIFRGVSCPIRDIVSFQGLDSQGFQVYELVKYKIEEIDNSFAVRTFAIWKGQIFDTDRFEDGRFRIWSENRDIAHQGKMEMIEQGLFTKWVPRTEIIRVWEKRTNSRYPDLPFPAGLSKIAAVDFFA